MLSLGNTVGEDRGAWVSARARSCAVQRWGDAGEALL